MDLNEQARKAVERSEEIESRLGDPAVLADKRKFAELSRTHKSLADLAAKSRQYLAFLQDLDQWSQAARDPGDAELAALAQEELGRLQEQRPALEEELKLLLVPKDPNDLRSAMLEIRAGTGGDEASIFAGDLYRMYRYYIEARGWKISMAGSSEGTAGGFKEIICEIEGEGCFGALKFESGVHRVQRVPETEQQGRVHTSAASVVVMPVAEEVDDIEIRENDLRIDTYRAGGAGGQHINKTDSAVRITHLPSGLVVACQDERSQHKNRDKAMNLLRTRLLDLRITEQQAQEAAARKLQVGTGDRSAKIRTYNFPQGRVTDHRVNLTLYKLDAVMRGDIQEFIDALHLEETSQKLRALERQS